MSEGTRPPTDDLHEWVSFDEVDPEDGTVHTWMLDATFLRSDYHCIWGAGCQGVLDADATELAQGCCSYGAHFVDDDDVQTVVRAFVKLGPEHMQFHAQAVRGGFLRAADPDPNQVGEPPTVTRLIDDACIFLNRPGFPGGAGCALHIGALAAGARPLDWKPGVCWQVPIRLEHTTDDYGHVTSRVSEWKRRDWGEGGKEFHWWCIEAPEAFTAERPMYRTSADELTELIGAANYARLVQLMERPDWTPLPHPVVRRR